MARVIAGCNEVDDVRFRLRMAVVVIALHRRLLDGAVHALDLAIGPWMVQFGQPVLDPVCLADQFEPHGPRIDGVPVSGLLSELDTVARREEALFVSYGHARSRQIAQRVAITGHRSQQWFC